MAASASLGDMVVRIVGDNSQFDKSIKDSRTKFQKFADDAGRIGKKFSLFVTLPILGVATAITKLAIDAEETRAKFQTAFRGIEKQADNTANNLAKNYGLARTQAERLLSGTGDLLKGFGATATEALGLSEKVQEISVDLASYNNVQGGAERASEIVTKALLGERDALTALGIKVSEADIKTELLRQGYEDLEGQALLLAKAEVTLGLITAQSGDALGDFARTSTSAANMLRTLKSRAVDIAASFGQTLLPVVERIIEKVGNLVEWFGRLDEGQRRTILVVAGVVAAIGPLLMGIKMVTVAVVGLQTAMAFLVANPIILVLAGIAAIVAVVSKLTQYYRQMKRAQDDVADGMDDLADSTDDATEAIEALNKAYKESPQFSEQRRKDIDAEISATEDQIKAIEAKQKSWARDLVVQDLVQKERDAEIAQLDVLKDKLSQLALARSSFISGTLGIDVSPSGAAVTLPLLDELQKRLTNLNELQKAGAISEAERFEQQIELREELIDKIKEQAIEGEIEADIAAGIIEKQIYWISVFIEKLEKLEEVENKIARTERERVTAQESRIERVRVAKQRLIDAAAEGEKNAKAEHEDKMARYQQEITVVQALVTATVGAITRAYDTTTTAAEKANDAIDTVLTLAALVATQFGPTGMVVAAVLVGIKAIKDAIINMVDQFKGGAQAYEDAMTAAQSRILDNQLKTNKALLDAQLDDIDEREHAALEAAGLLDKTATERAQGKLDDLKKQLVAEVDGEKRAALEIRVNDAADAVAKAELQAKFEDERIAAKEAAAEKERKYLHDLAVINQEIAIAQAKIDKESAIASLGWFASEADKADVAALYDDLISSIRSIPIPSLATGAIAMPRPGGQIVRVAEAGVPEIISPIDRLGDIIAQMPQPVAQTMGDTDAGDIHLVVQMDSKPILDKIFPASRDRTVLIDARAVV